jgi:hypothetical protein
MKLNFFNASELEQKLKCAIHKTGKLGFSESAIKKLGINDQKYIKIASNEADEADKNLYMVIAAEKDNEGFKINKAGNYYYLNTKALFDKLNFDYINTSIMFDIIEIEGEEYKIYKLLKREVKKLK